MTLIIVSGLSGSGKSTALHVLEDLGYYCVDNLPVGLLPAFAAEMVGQPPPHALGAAVGIDARNAPDNLQRFPEIMQELTRVGVSCEIVFLDAENGTLLKRFSETRRKHPLTGPHVPLKEAIIQERRLLEPLSLEAQLRIDTSRLHQHQLRDLLVERVGKKPSKGLSVLFESFGYKNGIPVDADYVFDLRCLPNPHWESHLRPLTGKDPEVAHFLEKSSIVEEMYQGVRGFLETWIPRFEADNRSYMTIALGCTGGQHRSVYFVERLARHFRELRGDTILARHRELS